MSITAIILIILLGIILLLIEFLIVPGVTVAGIGGSILLVGGVICAYIFHSSTIGNYVLLGTVLAIIAIFIWAFKAKSWRRFGLETSIEGHAPENPVTELQVGDKGKSVSRLAPIGKAMIGNKVMEVRSNGGYIDANQDIQVIRIEQNKIFVETLN